MYCPVKSNPEWIDLVNRVGEDRAYVMWAEMQTQEIQQQSLDNAIAYLSSKLGMEVTAEDLEITNGLIRLGKYAATEKSAEVLLDNPADSVAYTAAFNHVWQTALKKPEQGILLNELSGILGREVDEIEASEALAMDFAMWKSTGKSKYFTSVESEPKTLIEKMYDKIAKFIKFLVGVKDNGIEATYLKIDSGMYRDLSTISMTTADIKLGGYDAGTTKDFLDTMNLKFFGFLSYNMPNVRFAGKDFNEFGVNLVQLYNDIRAELGTKDDSILGYFNTDRGFKDAVRLHQQYLRQYGIKVDILEDLDAPEVRDSKSSEYADSDTISTIKISAPFIKLMMSNIIDRSAGNNSLDYEKTYPLTTVWKTVQQVTLDKFSQTAMMKALESNSSDPIIAQVYDIISAAPEGVKNLFFKAFSNSRANGKVGLIKKNGLPVIIDANEDNIIQAIFSTWEQGMRMNDSTYSVVKGLNPARIKAFNPKNEEEAREFLQAIGINYTGPMNGFVKVNKKQKSILGIVASIHKDMMETSKKGVRIDSFGDISSGSYSNVKALAKLQAAQELQSIIENQSVASDGSNRYEIVKPNPLNMMRADILQSSSIEELVEKLPHLARAFKIENGEYIFYSPTLAAIHEAYENNQKPDLEIITMYGMRPDIAGSKGEVFKKMQPDERKLMDTTGILNAMIPFRRAGDKGTQRYIEGMHIIDSSYDFYNTMWGYFQYEYDKVLNGGEWGLFDGILSKDMKLTLGTNKDSPADLIFLKPAITYQINKFMDSYIYELAKDLNDANMISGSYMVVNPRRVKVGNTPVRAEKLSILSDEQKKVYTYATVSLQSYMSNIKLWWEKNLNQLNTANAILSALESNTFEQAVPIVKDALIGQMQVALEIADQQGTEELTQLISDVTNETTDGLAFIAYYLDNAAKAGDYALKADLEKYAEQISLLRYAESKVETISDLSEKFTNRDVDLLGDPKGGFMTETSPEAIDIFLKQGLYNQAISEGRMTAQNAMDIIGSSDPDLREAFMALESVAFGIKDRLQPIDSMNLTQGILPNAHNGMPIVEYLAMQHLVGSFEQHFVFLGDLDNFKLKDYFKRMSMAVGNGSVAITDSEAMNTALVEDYNSMKMVNENYRQHRIANPDSLNFMTIEDVYENSPQAEQYRRLIEKFYTETGKTLADVQAAINSIMKAYTKDATEETTKKGGVNVADAASVMLLPYYREFMIRHQSWSPEQEYTFESIDNGTIDTKNKQIKTIKKSLRAINRWLKDTKLTSEDFWSKIRSLGLSESEINLIKNSEGVTLKEKFTNYLKSLPDFGNLNTIKPKGFGFDSDGETSGIKTSVMPIYPGMTRHIPELKDSGIEELIQIMMDNSTDMLSMQSAVKVGTPETTRLLDGKNFTKDYTPKTLPVRWFQIQVEMPSEAKDEAVEGSQQRVQIFSDLFSDGVADPDVEQLSTEYNELFKTIINNEKRDFLAKTGMTQVGDSYFVTNPDKLIELVKEAALSGNLPMNIVDSLEINPETGEFKFVLDSIPASTRIMNVIMARANNNMIRLKKNLSGYVQVPNLFFKGKETDKRLEWIINPTITVDSKATIKTIEQLEQAYKAGKDFSISPEASEETKAAMVEYNKTAGNLQGAQIYLPYNYIERLGLTPEQVANPESLDPRLLHLLGYRIPTEGPASISKLIVKGFLPLEMGDTVVVPEDIPGVAGSDFDIDKMYIIRPNVDSAGNYVQPFENLEQAWESYEKRFVREIENLRKIVGSNPDAARLLMVIKEMRQAVSGIDPAAMSSEGAYLFDDISSVVEDEAPMLVSFIRQHGTVAFNKEQYMTMMDGNLLAANNKQQLQNRVLEIELEIMTNPKYSGRNFMANSSSILLDQANKYTKESKLPNKSALFKLNVEWAIAEAFLAGKDLVGRTAQHLKFRTLAQMSGLRLRDVIMTELGKERAVELYMDGVKADSLSIGSRYNYAGELISQLFAQHLTAFVDASADPFIFRLNTNEFTLDAKFIMMHMGAPIDYVHNMLLQPIVLDYVAGMRKVNSGINKIKTKGRLTEAKLINDLLLKYNPKVPKTKRGIVLKDRIAYNQAFSIEQLSNQRANPTADQAMLLMQFLEYKENGEALSYAINAATQDTKGSGKSLGDSLEAQARKQAQFEGGIIANFGDLYDKTPLGAFNIGAEDFALGAFLQLSILNEPEVRDMIQRMISDLLLRNNRVDTKDINKLIQTYISARTAKGFGLDFQQYKNYLVPKPDKRFKSGFNMAGTLGGLIVDMKKQKLPASQFFYPVFVQDTVGDRTNVYVGAKIDNKRMQPQAADYITQTLRELAGENSEVMSKIAAGVYAMYGNVNHPNSPMQLLPTDLFGEGFTEAYRTGSITPEQAKDIYFANNSGRYTIVPFKRDANVQTTMYKGQSVPFATLPMFKHPAFMRAQQTVFELIDGESVEVKKEIFFKFVGEYNGDALYLPYNKKGNGVISEFHSSFNSIFPSNNIISLETFKAVRDNLLGDEGVLEAEPYFDRLTDTTQAPVSAVKPENISSKGSEFAKKLTNVGNTVGIIYKGKQYVNSEHAYQTWKSGEFDQKGYDLKGGKVREGKIGDTFSIMIDILTEKLKQHPDLVRGINERGGLAYIQQSTHNVIGDNFWESTGQNKFIEALAKAYQNVTTQAPVSSDIQFNQTQTVSNLPVTVEQDLGQLKKDLMELINASDIGIHAKVDLAREVDKANDAAALAVIQDKLC